MGLFTKDAAKRLADTFDYIDEIGSDPAKAQLLVDWVYSDGPYEPATISELLSLDVGVWGKLTGSTTQRRAIRAATLARIAAEVPTTRGPVDLWITGYKDMKTDDLNQEIADQLAKLRGPAPLIPSGVSPPMGAYASLNQVLAAKGALKAPTVAPVVNLKPPPVPVGTGASSDVKRKYFEDVSRAQIVLSGHGSWPYDSTTSSWPRVTLGKQQELRCYVAHFYPLKNDVGQLVDNRRFPAPTETFAGGTSVPDYTLHHKDKLKLLNHSKGDVQFVTVTSDTRLSAIINKPEYASAIFHWAACRVVFNASGQVACPTHNGWENYGGNAPLPCVLR